MAVWGSPTSPRRLREPFVAVMAVWLVESLIHVGDGRKSPCYRHRCGSASWRLGKQVAPRSFSLQQDVKPQGTQEEEEK
jgi:hypothetical protein